MKQESAYFGLTKTILAAGVAVILVAGAAACNKQESGQSAKEHEADSGQPTPVQELVGKLEGLCTTTFAGECEAAVDAAMADYDLGDMTKELGPLCKADKAGWACLSVARLKHKVADNAGAREYVLNSCLNGYLAGCAAAGDIALELKTMRAVGKVFQDRDLLRFYSGVLLAVDTDQTRALDLFSAFCGTGVMEMCEAGGVYAESMGVHDQGENLASKACQAGRVTACRSLGGWHTERKETDKAIQAYEIGCAGGDQLTCVFLADLLHDQGDMERSSRLCREACDAGESIGCIGLGRNHGEAGQLEMSARYYDKACDLKEMKGCYLHGIASMERGFNTLALLSLNRACDGGEPAACAEATRLTENLAEATRLQEMADKVKRFWEDSGVTNRAASLVTPGSAVGESLRAFVSQMPEHIAKGNIAEVRPLVERLKNALSTAEGRRYAGDIKEICLLEKETLGPLLGIYATGLEHIVEEMSGRRLKPRKRVRILEEVTGIELWKKLKNFEREVLGEYRPIWTVQATFADELRDTYEFPEETRGEGLALASNLAELAIKGVTEKEMGSARESFIHFWRDVTQYERKRPY
jgi:TPR repeat protein